MAPQREWFEKDYYKVLGVSDTASAKDITKAYRRLARQYHPDANQGDAKSEDRFKEISSAYDVVGDEAKRKEYDEARRLGPMGGFTSGPGPGGFHFETGGEDGLGDLLGNLFGRRRNAPTGTGPRRGTDLEAELTLSFVDAVHGLTTTLQLISDTPCATCHGTGARQGTSPRLCQVCGGRGVTDENQGVFSFSQPCYACQGRGSLIDSPCAACAGSGIERRPREVKVKIPAGVDDGQRIRLKGRGGPGRNGGPHGDLFVTCRVQKHPQFARDGDNLVVRVPVTFPEAALGANVGVPLLDGGSVTLRLRPGTQPGARQRVKGKGVTTAKGTGDLVVTFDVTVPTKLSSLEQKTIEELSRLMSPAPRARMGRANDAGTHDAAAQPAGAHDAGAESTGAESRGA